MLKSIRFKVPYRTFKEGREIVFREGINYVVGPNGSGKSSLIGVLDNKTLRDRHVDVDKDEQKMLLLKFDMELDNPRSQTLAQSMDSDRGLSGFAAFFNSRHKSHGEANRKILLEELSSWNDRSSSPTLVMLDEPEQAFSLDKILEVKEVLRRIAGNGHQLIVSTHHPLIIIGETVYSMEHESWMSGEDYFRLTVGEDSWEVFKNGVNRAAKW